MTTGDLNYICKNKLDKACFCLDIVSAFSKDLTKRTISDKFLKVKAFEIMSNVWSKCLKAIKIGVYS